VKDDIAKRKSTRKYDMKALDESLLNDIKEHVKTIKPLYEHIRYEYSFVTEAEVKNILQVKAPHYIIISSEPTEGYLTNIGFIFQQMSLYLTSIGLGSCWLGMAKPTEKIDTALEFVIVLAFGKALDSPYRENDQFKRKSLAQISDSADIRVEPARLAPSAVNSQPWYFVSDGDTLHLYCIKSGLLKGLIYNRLNKIDVGIALAHLYVSNPSTFAFTKIGNPPQVKGYYYIGSVKLS
jgi:hypothetical protein